MGHYKMKSGLVIVAFVLLVACSRPSPAEFNVVGQSQHQITERFGKPARIMSIEAEIIARSMGPKPEFVRSLPPNEQITVWSYSVKGGSVQLYFHNGEQVVATTIIDPSKTF